MFQPTSSPQTTDQFVRSLNAAAEQGRSILDSSFHTWAAELGALFEELAKDDAQAANEVTKCRTPIQLLAVQQKWLSGRAEAYLNAGIRMVLGVLHEPESAAADEAGAFRLPE